MGDGERDDGHLSQPLGKISELDCCTPDTLVTPLMPSTLQSAERVGPGRLSSRSATTSSRALSLSHHPLVAQSTRTAMLHRSLAQSARSAARPFASSPARISAPPRRSSPSLPSPPLRTRADSRPHTVARGYAEPAPTGQSKATSETSGPHQTIPHAPPKPTPFFARKNIGLEVTPLMAFIGTVRSLSLSSRSRRACRRRSTSPTRCGAHRLPRPRSRRLSPSRRASSSRTVRPPSPLPPALTT